jgi:hypothetical protein
MKYGTCPTCKKPGKSRERSPTGNTFCEDGHGHPHAAFTPEDPDNRFKDFSEFDVHVILYSKSSWYKHTDIMADLKTLITKIAMLPDVGCVSDVDVCQMVSGTMHKVLAVNNSLTNGDMDILYKEVWRTHGGYGENRTSITIADMIESHLRVIRHKSINHYPRLPDPNPEYLPLKDEEVLQKWSKRDAEYPEILKTITKGN